VRFAVLLAGLLGFGLTAMHAALQYPAQVSRNAASEGLKVTVRQVHTEKDESNSDGAGYVEIVAQVLEVRKTLTNLRPGKVIIIRYYWNLKAEARAREEYEARARAGEVGREFLHSPDIPVEGDLMMAYLNSDSGEETRQSKIYYPGASQYSFLILKTKAAN
jgi:hypothetical protein